MLAVEVLRRRNINEEDSVGGLETNPDAFGNRLIEIKDFLVAEENIAWRHLGRDVSEIFLGNWVVSSRQPLSDEGAVFLASELADHVSLTFLDIFQDGQVDEEVRDYFGNWGFDLKWIPRSD